MPADTTVSYTIGDAQLIVAMPTGFSSPYAHCGAITTSISGTSTAVVYDAANDQLLIETSDSSLAGTTQVVLISSTLTDYPTIIGDQVSIFVGFVA